MVDYRPITLITVIIIRI